jgi:excinuclease ABC subunit C
LPCCLSDKDLLSDWLSERRGSSLKLRTPKRGEGAALVRLAKENAESGLAGQLQIRAGGKAQLTALKAFLGLQKMPLRIEGFDISNIGGINAVGSMVVFEDGKAKKSDYRHFRIKTIQGADDFAMMAEVLGRRLKPEKQKERVYPDLILIDGGKGQLSSVCSVISRINSHTQLPVIDLISLAKERDEKGERVYLPGASEPIELPSVSPVSHLLMQVRDEAHRFAISYHRKLRNKQFFETPLQKVKGIGPLRRRALLKHFGSLDLIRQASLEALQAAPGMNRTVAKHVFEDLKK